MQMRSKENIFRRAAKDDLKPVPEMSTGIQIAEIKDSKNKADIRRNILGTRDTVVQSAKNLVGGNKEFFSSRKNFGHDHGVGETEEKKTLQIKKFQTDRKVSFI